MTRALNWLPCKETCLASWDSSGKSSHVVGRAKNQSDTDMVDKDQNVPVLVYDRRKHHLELSGGGLETQREAVLPTS